MKESEWGRTMKNPAVWKRICAFGGAPASLREPAMRVHGVPAFCAKAPEDNVLGGLGAEGGI